MLCFTTSLHWYLVLPATIYLKNCSLFKIPSFIANGRWVITYNFLAFEQTCHTDLRPLFIQVTTVTESFMLSLFTKFSADTLCD